MDEFTWTPDWGASAQSKPRIRIVKYGDGYEQRSPDGINFQEKTFKLDFSRREESEIRAINQFLEDKRAMDPFLYRSIVVSKPKIAVICRDWTWKAEENSSYSLSAQFERDFSAFSDYPDTPTYSIDGGDITFACATSGVSIYYNYEASDTPIYPAPVDANLYSGPFPVLVGRYRVIAVKDGMPDSAELNYVHT